jgi:hypothetical protein
MAKLRARVIGDFQDWKGHDAYGRKFARMVRAADLPVEQATKFEFVANGQGARHRGANSVQLLADGAIEVCLGLLHCMSPFMALPRHIKVADDRPLSGEERSCTGHHRNDRV